MNRSAPRASEARIESTRADRKSGPRAPPRPARADPGGPVRGARHSGRARNERPPGVPSESVPASGPLPSTGMVQGSTHLLQHAPGGSPARARADGDPDKPPRRPDPAQPAGRPPTPSCPGAVRSESPPARPLHAEPARDARAPRPASGRSRPCGAGWTEGPIRRDRAPDARIPGAPRPHAPADPALEKPLRAALERDEPEAGVRRTRVCPDPFQPRGWFRAEADPQDRSDFEDHAR